jgi:F-type H+-transporting ATPase subunit a
MLLHLLQDPHAQQEATKTAGKAAEEAGKVDIGGTILHHITNSHELELPFLGVVKLPHFDPIQIGSLTIDLSPSKHVVMMWIVAVLLLLVFTVLARPKLIPKGLYNFFESIIVFIREEIVRPNFGDKTDSYINYFLTVFFFILFSNLLGLIPYGSTATGNIAVTATLAVCTFLVTQYSAVKAQGILGYFKHLMGGIDQMDMNIAMKAVLIVIMVPVEFIGLFTKPFALCIRLFANMTAGHVVILSLIGLIFVLKSVWVGLFVSIPMSLFIYMLELFVAFLQAYVFTLLSAIFIGMALHSGHEEHHAEAGHH